MKKIFCILLLSLNVFAEIVVDGVGLDLNTNIGDTDTFFVVHSNGNVFIYAAMANWLSVSVCTEAEILANIGSASSPGTVVPRLINLKPAFPNPFNPTSTIDFTLTQPVQTKLTIHNIDGQAITVLIDDVMSAGDHSVDFRATGLASGVYAYTLEAGGFRETKTFTLIK